MSSYLAGVHHTTTVALVVEFLEIIGSLCNTGLVYSSIIEQACTCARIFFMCHYDTSHKMLWTAGTTDSTVDPYGFVAQICVFCTWYYDCTSCWLTQKKIQRGTHRVHVDFSSDADVRDVCCTLEV